MNQEERRLFLAVVSYLGLLLNDVKGDPKAVQFFDLRILAAAQKVVVEADSYITEHKLA